jgi:hypothetical protein
MLTPEESDAALGRRECSGRNSGSSVLARASVKQVAADGRLQRSGRGAGLDTTRVAGRRATRIKTVVAGAVRWLDRKARSVRKIQMPQRQCLWRFVAMRAT